MKKALIRRIATLILTVSAIAFALGSAAVPVYAAASDYGMSVTKMYFYYAKDSETNKFNMYYQFKFGATGNYDVSYTIKLLDSGGNKVTGWDGETYKAGANNKWFRLNFNDCNGRLTTGSQYTVRVTGECVAGGKTQSYYWDYTFTHDTSINDYSFEDLGMNAKKSYIEYDYGDFNTKLLLSANKGNDVNFVVELLDTKNNVAQRWNKVTISAWNTDKGYTFNTKGLALWDVGTYIYRVRCWVPFDTGVSRYGYWDFKYTVN